MESTRGSVSAEVVRGWRTRVAQAPITGDDAELIDQLHDLEVLKAAVEARQARVMVAFDTSQRAVAAARGVPPARQGRGIAEQLALARRTSPHRGRILLGLAKTVATEMPHTARAWREGRITEHRALVLARETACLTRTDRAHVDLTLALDTAALEAMSDRALEGQARALAARLDPAAVTRRRRRAEADRCVTLRPAPDTMVYLTALLPLAAGVAAYAALRQAAAAAVGSGAATSTGQAMADALTTRLLHTTTTPDRSGKPVVPVAINLVISDHALLDPHSPHDPNGGVAEEAELAGYGPIPAGLARELIADSLDAGLKVWLRRLYADPVSGRLIAMDTDQRLFPKTLADFIGLRDRYCRNPWCNAPIRHRDHARPAADGGPTTAENGQGLCEQCNHAKQAPGWHSRTVPRPGQRHTVVTTTPTGHSYRSTAPPAPGSGLRIDLHFAA